ncbi:hypothetical protein GCM10010273_56040 [Streptomyces lavendulocolor]
MKRVALYINPALIRRNGDDRDSPTPLARDRSLSPAGAPVAWLEPQVTPTPAADPAKKPAPAPESLCHHGQPSVIRAVLERVAP